MKPMLSLSIAFRASFIIPVLALALVANAFAADPFAENVRSTPWLSPEDERNGFHLPPGFEIELFASEPEIAKPMNMNFDSRGRLWTTVTVEYPYPVPLGTEGRDAIKILEDTDGDGRADRVSTFAEGLNIPIGIYPYRNGAVVWSIPHIWWIEDTDGDGRGDRREKLYGPLGWERDTHGMNSSFTRGFDGWLYATHGFNNNTVIRGKDGSEVRMNSGNVYRMRLDGARVEQVTWGQVNPFGLCFDPAGNLYSADCHSEPLYQLLRGGYYPSFGKPHDGLGFAPSMIFHGHGSTAISGIAYIKDLGWPEEFQDNLLTGNVMTSRIDRDAVAFTGASPLAEARPAFIRSDDPWFRPVNMQIGPDGALYIADFYNRIIGHYEVPLDHPGRDRTSGRIWRVAYKGDAGQTADPSGRSPSDLRNADVDELLREFERPNLSRRMAALNELSDRIGDEAIAPARRTLARSSDPRAKIHCLWLLHRLNALDVETTRELARDPNPLVRVHSMRALSEMEWTQAHRELALAGLTDSDALARRAAAEALGQHAVAGPQAAPQIAALAALFRATPPEDTHLRHVAKIALRNQFRPKGNFDRLADPLPSDDLKLFADLAIAVDTADAGSFLLRNLNALEAAPEQLAAYLRHAARYAPLSEIGQLAEFAQDTFGDDLPFQMALFDAAWQGAAQRGAELPPNAREWGRTLARRILQALLPSELEWSSVSPDGGPAENVPWAWETRESSDGAGPMQFMSSLPGGERSTGILRSPAFAIPERLSFFLAGQSGFPGQNDPMRNFVRLRSAKSGEILKEAPAPKNDVAQRIEWDLRANAGEFGFLEAVDRDDGAAYAWLAFARIEPPILSLPKWAPRSIPERRAAALELAARLQVSEAVEPAKAILDSDAAAPSSRVAAAHTLAVLDPQRSAPLLAALLRDAREPAALRAGIAQALASASADAAQSALEEAIASAPGSLQTPFARALASLPNGPERLVELAEEGKVSARVLQDRAVADRVTARDSGGLAARVHSLIETLIPQEEKVRALMARHTTGLAASGVAAERGAAVFEQNCAACHQLNGKGSLVGPQLDGIANRGLERIVEDVLDPNRNVDRAFRSHLFILKNEDVVSGLPRREEGNLIVLADSTGKEFSIQKNQVEERREGELSLMPENFGDILSESDLNDLFAFLMAAGREPDGQ